MATFAASAGAGEGVGDGEEEVSVATLHSDFLEALLHGEVPEESVAADARVCKTLGGAGQQGKAAVLDKLREVATKLSSASCTLDAPLTMRSRTQTRSIVAIKKGFVTIKLGVMLQWARDLAVVVVLDKLDGSSDDFLVDDTEPPVAAVAAASSGEQKGETETDAPAEDGAAESGAADGEASPHRGATALTHCLSPPWLVPRPEHFPPPTVHVSVIRAEGLQSVHVVPRPVNSYVVLRFQGSKRKTEPVRNNKSPTYPNPETWVFQYDSALHDDLALDLEVKDRNVGHDTTLAVESVPLSMIEASDGDLPSELAVDLHLYRGPLKRRGKHSTPHGRLFLSVAKSDMRQWWAIQELQARDEQARQEEEERAQQEAHAAAEQAAKHAEDAGATPDEIEAARTAAREIHDDSACIVS